MIDSTALGFGPLQIVAEDGRDQIDHLRNQRQGVGLVRGIAIVQAGGQRLVARGGDRQQSGGDRGVHRRAAGERSLRRRARRAVGRIRRGAEHQIARQLVGLLLAVVLLGDRLVDHARDRRLPHQLRQRTPAEIGHSIDDLRQVRANLNSADLGFQVLQLLLRDADQLELLRHRRLEVLAALRQRPIDEGEEVFRGLGHFDAGLLEGGDLAFVGAVGPFADDRAGMAHARAARKDVLRPDAGDAGDDRLGILGFLDVAGGLLFVVAAHLAHENHQLRAFVVAHEFEQLLEIDAGDSVAADADDDAHAVPQPVEDFRGDRKAHAAALREDGDFAGIEHAGIVAADGADLDAIDGIDDADRRRTDDADAVFAGPPRRCGRNPAAAAPRSRCSPA